MAVSFISVSPPILIEAVAGLALLGVLATSFVSAMARERNWEAALVTLLVTVLSVTFFGICGAFWGLIVGGAIYLWEHRRDAETAEPREEKAAWRDPRPRCRFTGGTVGRIRSRNPPSFFASLHPLSRIRK